MNEVLDGILEQIVVVLNCKAANLMLIEKDKARLYDAALHICRGDDGVQIEAGVVEGKPDFRNRVHAIDSRPFDGHGRVIQDHSFIFFTIEGQFLSSPIARSLILQNHVEDIKAGPLYFIGLAVGYGRHLNYSP